MRQRRLKEPWPCSPTEARLLQERLRGQVVAEDQIGALQLVAGVDAHYDLDRLWAAIVVMTFPDLVIVESALGSRPLAFPYAPGLLSFREAPAILEILPWLSQKPDVLVVDGQGLAHPRRFGLACHLGVLGDVAAIGVAKSRLVGVYQEPGAELRLTRHDVYLQAKVLAVRRRPTHPEAAPAWDYLLRHYRRSRSARGCPDRPTRSAH